MKISINQQIEEIEAEIVMRGNVYPRLVSTRKMKRTEAEYKIERMCAVLRTLQWLRENEDAIKARVPAEVDP